MDPKLKKSGLVAYFEPHVKQGGFVPMFGDLDGDGVVDAVFRLDNGITERSADPGVPVELEAFTSYGKSICAGPWCITTSASATPTTRPRCFGTWMGTAKRR